MKMCRPEVLKLKMKAATRPLLETVSPIYIITFILINLYIIIFEKKISIEVKNRFALVKTVTKNKQKNYLIR